MFRSFSAILMVLMASNCAVNKNIKPYRVSEGQEYKIDNVILKEHQILPIEYLLKNKNQKGLIIDHYLGTGKTYTALGFAEKNPDKDVIILAPAFLESNWVSHMRSMGIKNLSRYEFISYDQAPQKLAGRNLSQSILIADEIHRLVEKVKSSDKKVRKKYGDLYLQLRQSERILLLTGTPVFNELSDIAYSINLVCGQDLLPYNDRVFLDKYTKVMKGRSFWRGHFTESQLLMFTLPFILGSIPIAFITPTVAAVALSYFGGITAGFAVLPAINAAIPLHSLPLRSFVADELSGVAQKYVSFYDFREDNNEHYPTQKLHDMDVSYNRLQDEYFMDFADMGLNTAQVKMLARESKYMIESDSEIDSTPTQEWFRQWPDSGREIGNFDFVDERGGIIESPKFEKILEVIGKEPNRVAVYSSYLQNGIELFAEFLKRHGMADKFKILRPEASITEQIALVDAYNRGDVPVLLLHPVFTEGLSLQGTQQLHILEPMPSQALFEQIIGRAIRYNSHAALPKEMRRVNVYAWKSTFSGLSAMAIKNENWAKRFNELNSISAFGAGMSRIDNNFKRKQMSPDEFTDLKRLGIKNAMESLNDLFKEYSIEKVRPSL